MKKIIAFLLMSIMLISLAACAKDTSKQNSNKDDNSEGIPQGKLWDKKEFDFDEYEFVIIGKAKTGSAESWGGDDLNSDEMTGDEVIDEVYNRNRLIETTYNCFISSVVVADGDIKNTIMSGNEEDANLLSHTLWKNFSLAEEQLLLDFNDPGLKYLNLDKPWYNQTFIRDNTMAGRLYLVNGDMLFTDDNAIWITLFNKELAERYVSDINLYDAVREGKWTVDMFMKYAKLATTELVADDKMNYLDQWGYVGQSANVAAVVAGAGYRYAEITQDGGIVANVFDKDFQNVFLKAYETVDKSFCVMATDITGVANIWITMIDIFEEGRALFSLSSMMDTIAFREMEVDFGVLPVPKLTEQQEEYYSWTTMNTNAVSIPYYCSDLERTSAIVEALFEESSYKLKPAYVDKTVKYQSTRDDESVEMIDIIMNSTIYDIGVVYNFGTMYGILDDLVIKRTMNRLSSTLQKNQSKINEAIDELIAKFQA